MAAEKIIDTESNGAGDDEDSEKKIEGEKPSDIVTRWLREIDASDAHEKDWRERAEKIVNLYKDARKKTQTSVEGATDRRFNILYANTEVTKGALYQRCPVPDIRRRWIDKDPIGRLTALILGRCVMTAIDKADLDSVLKQCVEDMTLPGRGLAQVKYKPTFESYEQRVDVEPPAEGVVAPADVQKDDAGHFRMEQVEELKYECVEVEYVEWDMVRFSPAKRHKKLRWMAFGELMTRDDLVQNFGKDIGEKVALKWSPKGVDDTKDENKIFKRALVWVIWNKTQKKLIAVCDGYKDAPLKTIDDPLNLEEFFPAPRALYAISTNDSMIPTPEYAVYQDHALDLDALEERISILQEALRRRGVFDASIPELEQLAKTGDNKFIGIKSYKEFVEKGGLEYAIQEQDLSNLAQVLKELMQLANEKKTQIYELIGISDLMRGTVDPKEKLGQSNLKSQYGTQRVAPRQQEVQRFARDIIRLMAEIIAEHFSPQTMQEMSGVQLAMNAQELQQLQLAAPDDIRCKRPTWDDVLKVLRSDKLRGFKIDIETDSTIKVQADQEQKNRVELVTAITGYLEKALPAVQQGLLPQKVASELLMFGVRAFPAGAQLEELLDEWASGGIDEMLQKGQPGAQQKQKPPSPEEVAAANDDRRKQELHDITKQMMNADLVKKRAEAYGALVEGEHLQPGLQLELQTKYAKLIGLLDPAADPAGAEDPSEEEVEGARPKGATLQ